MIEESDLKGWEQMVMDGLYLGPTATLRLVGEVRELRAALHDLILAPPWLQSRGSADVVCDWCDATTYGGASAEHFHDLSLHAETCPWRKARALLGLDGRALD